MRFLFTILILGAITGCGSNETKPTDETADTTAATTPAPPADNTLTAAEQSEGWQLLFDGTSKTNWHSFNNKTDGSGWKIADGSLTVDSTNKTGRGDLVTNEEYENFDLKLDWKIDTAGNSGILFYVQEDKKYEHTFHTGPEMQVLDNARHSDAKIIKHHAGDLYDLISGSPETVKPAGEWNHIEIKSKDSTLEFYLNDSKIVTTKMWDADWKKMIAGSKFKQWKDFGIFKKGHIALQDHGDPVWYKNIKIRKL
jgi:Domain of Unknown Function (DUF1080)